MERAGTLLSCALAAALASIVAAAPAARAEDHPNRIEAVLRGAEAGDPDMQYQLGLWKFWALPQHRDLPAALHWFCRAAEQGHAPAQSHLGLMYWTGNGVPRDPLQAYLWFHLAAEQGGEVAAEHRDRVGRDYLSPRLIALARALAERWHHAPVCPVRLS